MFSDHSNEGKFDSSAVLLHVTTWFSVFYKMKFDILEELLILTLLGVIKDSIHYGFSDFSYTYIPITFVEQMEG